MVTRVLERDKSASVLLQTNKAAKRPTTIQMTQVHICKDTGAYV